jgi:hypothetical protein
MVNDPGAVLFVTAEGAAFQALPDRVDADSELAGRDLERNRRLVGRSLVGRRLLVDWSVVVAVDNIGWLVAHGRDIIAGF